MRIYKTIIFLFLITSGFNLLAQDYWQQKVDYKINVSLDDTLHVLHGYVEMKYTNNSPDKLTYIYMHLWPNAYLNNKTPFAKQQIVNGSTKFHFAVMEDKGFIDSLDFKIDGKQAEITGEKPNYDIVKLILNKPLEPNESILISTPFRVMLPESFSRMGHIDNAYQITQWYPKPAVYDKKGWHPMSYLDQGEFYSEYGDFEVTITLPDNYVVAATGNLQNQSELDWLTNKAKETALISTFEKKSPIIPSSKTFKTLTYTESNIHDFAWFANKSFHVLKGEVELPYSKRKVTSWAFFTNEYSKFWVKALSYLNDATYYYSKWIGEYPYNNVTAVDGALSAGGGMEYPTITVIGAVFADFSLDRVITHEVGHNWFYGILGTNERDYAWMDEGINSFYENRYMKMKYDTLNTAKKKRKTSLFNMSFDENDLTKLGYQVETAYHLDQPCQHPSGHYTSINYGIIVYGKSALMMSYLEQYLGVEKYDAFMQEYFKKWKFKHPQPEDFLALLDDFTKEDFKWLLNDWMKTTNKIDFSVKNIQSDANSTNVKIKNRGKFLAPVPVSLIKNDSVLSTIWTKPFKGKTTVKFDINDFDHVELDTDEVVPEFNMNNNIMRRKGLFRKVEPLKLSFIPGIEQKDKSTLYLFPFVGANTTDKFMIGLGFYNRIVPKSRFSYTVLPMYSFERKALTGLADISYRIHPMKGIREVVISNYSSSFAGITKIEPKLTFVVKEKNLASGAQQSFGAYFTFIQNSEIIKLYEKQYGILTAFYQIEKTDAIKRFRNKLEIRNKQADFSLVENTFDVSVQFMKRTFMKTRLYSGFFVNANNVHPSYNLFMSGGTDYLMQTIYFDRAGMSNSYTGIKHQTDLSQGGLRGIMTDTLGNFASSTNGIVSMNFQFDFPKSFVSFYYDNGIFIGNSHKSDSRYFYTMGLNFRIIKNIFEIYMPFYGSNFTFESPANLKDLGRNLRFTLNLNEVKVRKTLEYVF
jgi:hypothetical protein